MWELIPENFPKVHKNPDTIIHKNFQSNSITYALVNSNILSFILRTKTFGLMILIFQSLNPGHKLNLILDDYLVGSRFWQLISFKQAFPNLCKSGQCESQKY